MNSAKNIEKLIKKLNVTPTAEMRNRTLNDALEAQENSKKIKSTLTEPSIWRIIVKSPISKLATAAVLIIAVVIGVNQIGGPINVASTAFAQMTKAIMDIPCVHVIIEGSRDCREHRREYWLCFESGITCKKDSDGRILFINLTTGKRHVYNPVSGNIIVSNLPSDRESLDAIDSPEKLLPQMLQELGMAEGRMTLEQGRYEGKEVDIYTAELPESDYSPTVKMTGKGELIADRSTHLPLYGQVKGFGSDGTVLLQGELIFKYPQSSPKDIYALGAPESADVIDSSRTPEVEEVLAAYRAYRDNAPKGHSIAVVRETTLPNGKVHRKIKEVKYANKVQSELQSVGWNSPILGNDPHTIELKIIEDEYSRKNNLICIQILREGYKRPPMVSRLPFKGLYYLNPGRDYICEKYEFFALREPTWQGGTSWSEENTEPECSSVNKVVRYGQTPSGKWYPKEKKAQTIVWNEEGTAEEYNYRITIYLDTEPGSFEDTLSPESK